jgi:hypothetical protein
MTPLGIVLPGPDTLPQPVRYSAQAPPDATAGAAHLLGAQKEPSTLLEWEQVQAVMVSEPLVVPEGALLLVDGETPRAEVYTLPIGALLILFMAFNIWYLLRSFRRPPN